jgi:hypothetical protein
MVMGVAAMAVVLLAVVKRVAAAARMVCNTRPGQPQYARTTLEAPSGW